MKQIRLFDNSTGWSRTHYVDQGDLVLDPQYLSGIVPGASREELARWMGGGVVILVLDELHCVVHPEGCSISVNEHQPTDLAVALVNYRLSHMSTGWIRQENAGTIGFVKIGELPAFGLEMS